MMIGPAFQSSTILGGVASRAIDGNDNGDWWGGSVTHTAFELNPWWQSGTLENRPAEFRIHNRTDCCVERLGRFDVWFHRVDGPWIRWREFNMGGLVTLVAPVPDGDWGIIDRIHINKLGEGYLSLAEVRLTTR